MQYLLDTFQQLHCLRPYWLLLLPPILLLIIVSKWHNRNRGVWRRYIDSELQNQVLRSDNRDNAGLKYFLAIFASLSIIALAGPSWKKLPQAVATQNEILYVVADMSLSMYADDIKPSRLIRQRYKLRELFSKRNEGKTGLIAYSGNAHWVAPVTDDSLALSNLAMALSPEIMPRYGSKAATAFQLIAKQISSDNPPFHIVWFTDEIGQNDRQHVATQIRTLPVAPASITIVGIGSDNGSPVKLPNGKFIRTDFGEIVNVKLNRDEIALFARQINASYIDLQNDNSDIEFIAERSKGSPLNSEFAKSKNEDISFDTWVDQGFWLVWPLILLCLLLFRRGQLLSIAFLLTPILLYPDSAYSQSLWKNNDQRAFESYKEQNYAEAAADFQDPNWRAMAHFKQGNYQEASELWKSIDDADAQYNRGHALAHLGQIEQAINAYDQALALNPQHQQAANAKAQLQSFLDQQAQQRKQDKTDSSNSNNDDNAKTQQDSRQDSDPASNSERTSSDDNSTQEQSGPPTNDDNEQNDERAEQANSADSSKQNKASTHSEDDNGPSTDSSADEKSSEDRDDEQGQQEHNAEDGDGKNKGKPNYFEQLSPENQRELKQWLMQIPDDPSGLLRRKFDYQQQHNRYDGELFEKDEKGQIW